MVRRIGLVAMAAACFAFAAGPALAGRGSISLVIPDAIASSTGGPHFGEQVTFSVSTNATSRPWVYANCYQNGTWVYGKWAGFFADYSGSTLFTLGPTNLWQGGDADCTAELVNRDNYQNKVLAKTSFHVYG
jgi:hypothetical protein